MSIPNMWEGDETDPIGRIKERRLILVPNPEVPSPEAMRLFFASTTERDDMSEEMFDNDELIPRLENKTSPVEIILHIIKKVYKDDPPPIAPNDLRVYVREQYSEYIELTVGDANLVDLINQSAAQYHPGNDLGRGVNAFRSAADQYYNYLFHETALKGAIQFCNYLAIGDSL